MRTQQGLETHGVFHEYRMAQLMNDNVINHEFRCFDNAPIDGDVFLFGTVSPLPFLAAYVESVVRQK